MDEQKLIDVSHEITNQLQHKASVKLAEAQAYYQGYVQACEDFGRSLRQVAYEQTN